MSELSNRLRNFRRWNSAHQNYDPVQICLEAADALDTALTRIRELEGAFAALGADPATPAWIQTFARALSSKDQEKTPLPFHDETMDGLNAMTIRKPV